MRILNILTQKPNSTGSGIYLTELVKQFQLLGHEQAVVAGIDAKDTTEYLPQINFFPVKFNTPALPFPVVGMSDVMPYPSTKYNQLTKLTAAQLETAFIKALEPVIDDFNPDLIICHHLYFLTSIVREYFPTKRIVGICHGTDLRQLKKTSLANARIIKNIANLDIIFALHRQQQKEISTLFNIPLSKIKILGTGYNNNIFYDKQYEKKPEPIKIIYAGKLTYKKGVVALINALNIAKPHNRFELYLAGGYSDAKEYEEIVALAHNAKYNFFFCGKLTQAELAEQFNQNHIMVLPSFFEGLPLVIIEALACGLRIVATDLPGIKTWLDSNIPNHHVAFVAPPRMLNVDEPQKDDLAAFQKNLAETLTHVIDNYQKYPADLSRASWQQVALKLLSSICVQ